MTDTLAHRGPDGDGIWIGGSVGLGHRRLAIVDLAGGAQPMSTADRALRVTFNGEIYNHAELRRDLERLGHRFVSSSDTEVLLHGYRQWGRELPARLNGMFTFAIADATSGTVFLARDRMGEKPLYYAHRPDGSLLFGSELKAILAHPGVERRLDVDAIARYLTYEYVPAPHAAVRGVSKLPPGDWLLWHGDGRLDRGTYSALPFGEQSPITSEREWIAELRSALGRAVQRRLMADVPLGLFLSGGLDSSAIAALLAQSRDPASIRTFSIAFEDPSFDESAWARRVARHLGTDHSVRTFTAAELLDVLPDVLSRMDEPFADASLLPTHLLCRFAREHVKVALGGDGGDELFLGYETFRADQAAQLWRRTPAALRSGVARLVDRLPVRTSNFSLDFVLRRFVAGADACDEFRHVRWLGAFLPHTPLDPLLPEHRERVPDGAIYGVMAEPYLRCPAGDHLQRLSFAYLRTYFAEDILTKVDRASMGIGLEARAVFVDPEVVSLAARMPSGLKLRGLTAKYALKEAVRGLLPDDVIDRPKKGFGIPVAKWLNGPLAEQVNTLLRPERIEAGGLLDATIVRRLVQEHREGSADHRKQIWTLLMLEAWRESHGISL